MWDMRKRSTSPIGWKLRWGWGWRFFNERITDLFPIQYLIEGCFARQVWGTGKDGIATDKENFAFLVSRLSYMFNTQAARLLFESDALQDVYDTIFRNFM